MKALMPLLAGAMLVSPVPSSAAESGTALTVYSSMRPGAVSPDLLRGNGGGASVPGYAKVRHNEGLPWNTAATACVSPTSQHSSIRPP
jgi:hypothetical protein